MVWNNSKLSDALQLRGDDEKFSAQSTLLNLTKTSVLSQTEDFWYFISKGSAKLLHLFSKEGTPLQKKKKKRVKFGSFTKKMFRRKIENKE